jgi:glycine/D-amino acid oxidase-like deaminating enzyme
VRNGLAEARPALSHSTSCDVVVWGAGITGALVADRLTSEGLDVVILDRTESGAGSTSASTALIQYEIDLELVELSERIGASNAVRAYQKSAEAVRRLAEICAGLDGISYQPRSSLYLASTRTDARRLEREAGLRAVLEVDAQWVSKADIDARYGFPSHGAIRSELSGEVDALALTRCLLARAACNGARWYEQTHVRGYEELPNGVRVRTSSGKTVDAKEAVCATGYRLPTYFELDVATIHSSFALATQRLQSFGQWDDRSLVWESARPYCYMRTTEDRRVLIGGEDVPFKNSYARDLLLPQKRRQLEERLMKMLPTLRTETAFVWAGTFAETPDGLPCIGRVEKYPGILFALGYGGNGITFSVIASEILSDLCLGLDSESADLFAMSR